MSSQPRGPIEHGPRDGRSVALTFDADLSPFVLPSQRAREPRPHRQILDLLRTDGIPATLFLTGVWVEAHPEDARGLGRDPLFEIGNHSYSHPAFAGPCFGLPVISSTRRKREEVLRGAAVIAAATGRRPRYFRFPGGCHATEDLELVRSLGAEPVQWDVLSGDAFDHDETSIAEKILSDVRPGSIVVMHLSEPRQSVACEVLTIVLPELRARGLSLVTLSELLGAGRSVDLPQEPTGKNAATAQPATPPQMPGHRGGLTILVELDRIYARMLQAGYPARIASGRRTIGEQINLYAKGRSFAEFRDALNAAVAAGSVPREAADHWIAHFDPGVGRHPMPPGEPNAKGVLEPVTWTFRSRHLTGDAADVVHGTLGWNAPDAFWEALRNAAQAEGLRIGPPARDRPHVQRP